MLDAAEQVDLVRLARLSQNLLGLVALGGREDGIGLCVFGLASVSNHARNHPLETHQPRR